MPAPDTEPENYSIDDMMERLRSRSDGGREGEAELVTRADGSQMYRVRKRKRRSHQPKKEKEKRRGKMQVVQVVVAGGVVVLTGLAFVASLAYLNSSSFRGKILGQAEEWSGAKIATTELRLSPVSVAAKAATLTWTDDRMISSLTVNEIKGDVSAASFLSGPWKGTEINAQNGTLKLRDATGKSPATAHKGELPFQFRYSSPHFNIVAGDGKNPAFVISNVEASYTVLNPEATKANLQLNRGSLTFADWGTYALKFASVQLENDTPRIGAVTLNIDGVDRSEISISNPSGTALDFNAGLSSYDVKISHVPLSSVAGAGLGSILSGDVDTPDNNANSVGQMTFQYHAKQQLSLVLPFRANPSNMPKASKLPLFTFLAERCKNDAYRAPKFELEGRGVIHRDQEGARIEDLILDTKGFLSITGKLGADLDGHLDGQLEIGIPEAVASDAGSDFLAVFSRRGRGLLWATVQISGTVQNPADDLADRIKTASTSRSPEGELQDLIDQDKR